MTDSRDTNNSSPDPLEVRVAKLEGITEQINKRLGNVEQAIRDLRQEVGTPRKATGSLGASLTAFDSLHQEIDALRESMDRHYRRIIVLVLVGYLVHIVVEFIPVS